LQDTPIIGLGTSVKKKEKKKRKKKKRRKKNYKAGCTTKTNYTGRLSGNRESMQRYSLTYFDI